MTTHSDPAGDAARPVAITPLAVLVVCGCLAFGIGTMIATPAAAQDLPSAARTFVEQSPLSFRGSNGLPVEIRGVTRALAPRWTASYGLGPVAETSLSATFLRYDQTLAFGTRSDAASRNDWRHFLGLQYAPADSLSFTGGIAKAGGLSGGKGTSLNPTGYERLRLNAGARLIGERWGLDGWAIDSAFSFIPTGATRMPSDASFFPSTGDSGPTWLFALTVSRRF